MKLRRILVRALVVVTIIVLIPIFLYLCIKAEEVFVRASRMMTFHAGRVLRSTTEALFD